MTTAVDAGGDGRRYAGRSSAQRRAERRGRLLAAGLEVFGTAGWSGATIEQLCLAAAVATRSFYEEYASREALLLAVYARVLADVTESVEQALSEAGEDAERRVRAGVAAYVDAVTTDPRRARIVHREVRAAGVLEEERHAGLQAFAGLIARESVVLGVTGPAAGNRLTALALAGAVNELLIDWVATSPPPPTAPLVDELTRLFLAALG